MLPAIAVKKREGVAVSDGDDAADRVTTKTLSHPTQGSIVYNFAYAATGASADRLVSVTAPGLSLSYAHNLFGQVTGASQQLTGSPALAVGYSYASNAAPQGMTYPSGRTVAYSLDGVGRISGISVNGVLVLAGVAYKPFGAIAGWTFGSGHTVSRTFDLNGRPTGVTLPTGQRTYGYDVDGRITGISDAVLGGSTYTYDGQDPPHPSQHRSRAEDLWLRRQRQPGTGQHQRKRFFNDRGGKLQPRAGQWALCAAEHL